MTCWKFDPVLPEYVELPAYTALIVWAPTASVVVVAEAAWPVPSIAAGAPKLIPSTRNWTDPDGVPEPLDTVAWKLIGWLKTDGLALLTIVVVDTTPVGDAIVNDRGTSGAAE